MEYTNGAPEERSGAAVAVRTEERADIEEVERAKGCGEVGGRVLIGVRAEERTDIEEVEHAAGRCKVRGVAAAEVGGHWFR